MMIYAVGILFLEMRLVMITKIYLKTMEGKESIAIPNLYGTIQLSPQDSHFLILTNSERIMIMTCLL